MPDHISEWLEQLGLGQYASNFIDNDIDVQLLAQLTDADLKELGISSLGHRKKIVGAIEALVQSGPPATATITPKDEAERRQLTVMFCDLVGSTELSQQLDPEDLRDVNRAYQDACKAAIERYEGYVARYMGDGVLAYFGYPQAHEDDAARAVHAGLAVVESVADLPNPVGAEREIELGVRVGIATGPVVVGDLIGEAASQESAVVGETPNLAARLQALASRNAVVIAPGTRALVMGRFEYEDLGEHALKGIAERVQVWRVIAPAVTDSRFAAAHQSELIPLVGRGHEIGLLLERWEQAKEGDGQMMLLCGEAGIGKSRIIETLRERITEDDPVSLRYQCSPYHTNSALYPIIEQLERAAQFDDEDSHEVKLEKLESLLGPNEVASVAPLFAGLLSIPVDGRYAALEMTPEWQKQKTLEVLVARVEGLSHHQPLLMIFEDVHWADPSSLELLELTMARAQRIPVLAVITFRPEFKPPWSEHTHVTTLTLNRFTRNLAMMMVSKVTHGKTLPEEVQQQIIEKTDGVPLFVEELTKTILESGLLTEESGQYTLSGSLADLPIPTTLRDSLMARLDRLDKGKPVAQAGAAIGREFSQKLLELVCELQPAELDAALNELIDSGLVFRQSSGQGAGFIFKHALVQEAAYESLLHSTCRSLHGDIADALLNHFPEITQSQPELLAHHYTEADSKKIAIKYWMQAGQRATTNSADQEAVVHLLRGLSLLESLPESPKRDQRELAFHLALSSPYINTKGWGSVETRVSYARAHELCELLGNIEQLLPILLGQWLSAIGDSILEAREIATELLRLSEQVDNVVGIMQSNRLLGFTAYFHGDYALIEPHIERSLSLYDAQKHQSLGLDWVYDPYVGGLVGRAIYQFASGQLDQALKTGENFVTYARELDQLSTLVYALWNQCILRIQARDARTAEKLSDEALTIAKENGFRYYISESQMLNGWSIAKCGRREEGLSKLYAELQIRRTGGNTFLLPYYFTLLAELHIDSSEFQEALQALDEARQYVEQTGERMWEAEIYRLMGYAHSLQTPGDIEQAQTCLEKAINLAKKQGIKPLELRATIDFVRLLNEQGEVDSACSLLEPIYESFTEGFDTLDLIAAKELLEQLT